MSSKPVTILVVEDDDVDVANIKRAFSQLKISNPVEHVKDGIEALSRLRGDTDTAALEPPYIIFLDLNMPRMNGFEFLEALRADETLNGIKVYALTTSETDDDIMGAYALDVAGYVIKSDLKESLREVFQSLNHTLTILD